MKRHYIRYTLATAIAVALVTPANSRLAAQSARDATPVEVQGGSASFDATTNISAISVHGRTDSLRGRAVVRQGESGIAIEKLEAAVSVKTLATGMGLRDEHMRKRVFTTEDGQVPDVTFVADRADCSGAAEATCSVSGQLAIRGSQRPFAMALKVVKAGDAYRASGDGTVKLSTYGIPQPSQLGVTTKDEVKLHLEFTAKPSQALLSRSGVTQ